MSIPDNHIQAAFDSLRASCGGRKEDYFGLLYLERQFQVPRERAVQQVAFGGNDYGVDGFHFDQERRILYIFQFKWTTDHKQFVGTFRRLVDAGLEAAFGNGRPNQYENQILAQLRSCAIKNTELIKKVYFQFVFKGSVEEADRSPVLARCIEQLDEQKHFLQQTFGDKQVDLVVEFASDAGLVSKATVARKSHTYSLSTDKFVERGASGNEVLYAGFVKLRDLEKIYREMGQRFFDRNIRSSLSPDTAANRSLRKAFRAIAIDQTEDPSYFAFDHNGVTLFSAKVEHHEGQVRVTEPRLLNGAQSVTTLSRFVDDVEKQARKDDALSKLDRIEVPCKIVSNANDGFVARVTINNNRQNPVKAWNLRANDMIQLEFEERFRDEHQLGIFYERQEKTFRNLTRKQLEEAGYHEFNRPIEITVLAQTLLATDGEIEKMSKLSEVFEEDRSYNAVFSKDRLEADFRKIVLCYKIQRRIGLILRNLLDGGSQRHGFIAKTRNLMWALLCQGVLNHPKVEELAERFGRTLVNEQEYTELLNGVAAKKVRPCITAVVSEHYSDRVEVEKYEFLRSRQMFTRCMEVAKAKYGWEKQRLR